MQALSTFTLWFILFVLLARFQEIFTFLVPLQLGKLSLGLGLCVVLAQNVNDLNYLVKTSPIKVYLLTMAFLAIVGVPFSVYPSEALSSTFSYLRLLLTSSIVVALGKNNARSFYLALISVLLFLSIQMLLQKSGVRVSVSSTYDPNDIALLCIVFLPLALAMLSQKGFVIKALTLAASGGAVASIALSGSRGGFVAMTSVALYAIILAKKRRFMLIVLIGLGAMIFMAMAGDALWERLQSLRDGTDYNLDAGGGRLEIWKNGLDILKSRPIFGVGIGQFMTGLGMLTNSPWKAAHNVYIEISVELGIGGFWAFMSILLFTYKLSIRGSKSDALTAQEKLLFTYLRLSLLGYCTGSFFLSQAYSPITYIFFCLVVVMHYDLEKKEAKAAQTSPIINELENINAVHLPLTIPPIQKTHLAPKTEHTPPPALNAGTANLSAQRLEQLKQAEAARKRKKSRLEAGDRLLQKKTRK